MMKSLFTGSKEDWNLTSNESSGCAFKNYKPLKLKGTKERKTTMEASMTIKM